MIHTEVAARMTVTDAVYPLRCLLCGVRLYKRANHQIHAGFVLGPDGRFS